MQKAIHKGQIVPHEMGQAERCPQKTTVAELAGYMKVVPAISNVPAILAVVVTIYDYIFIRLFVRVYQMYPETLGNPHFSSSRMYDRNWNL